FSDASGWAGVIAELQADGTPVLAVANPLRGLLVDSAYVASVINNIAGPVLLVSHSYGGAVASSAAVKGSNVVGLVFVAAILPDEGENILALTSAGPPTLLGPAL